MDEEVLAIMEIVPVGAMLVLVALRIFVPGSAVKFSVRFPFPVQEKVMVNDNFELRKLMYKENYANPYYVLLLTEQEGRLFNGSWNNSFEIKDTHFPMVHKDDYIYAKPTHSSSLAGYAHVKNYEKDKSELETIRLRDFFRKLDKALDNYLVNDIPLIVLGVRMRVNEINSRIESILDEIKIGTPAKIIYDLMIRKILMQDNKIRQRPEDRIQMDIAQCEARIRKLEDSYADESIDLEMFNNGLKRYRAELKLLKQEIETDREDQSIYQQYMKKGIDLFSNIGMFYQKADADTKKKVLCSIFPENLFFSKEKSRTGRMNEAVRLILTTSKGFVGQPTKNRATLQKFDVAR